MTHSSSSLILNLLALAISIGTGIFYFVAFRRVRRSYLAIEKERGKALMDAVLLLELSERRRVELENLLVAERQSPLWNTKRWRGPEA